jgi:hypothetical protein
MVLIEKLLFMKPRAITVVEAEGTALGPAEREYRQINGEIADMEATTVYLFR